MRLRLAPLIVAISTTVILIQAKSWAGAGPQAGTPQKNEYTLSDGKKITLNFPLFVDGKGPKVTKDIFRGYTLFNSYCYRCHGQDATESQLGPNLRKTLEKMTAPQFLATIKFGREDLGMPSWGGFLTDEELTSIYRYVKGRSLELVPVGRPPSEFD